MFGFVSHLASVRGPLQLWPFCASMFYAQTGREHCEVYLTVKVYAREGASQEISVCAQIKPAVIKLDKTDACFECTPLLILRGGLVFFM